MPIPSPFAHDGLLYLNGGTNKPVAAIKPGASGDLTTPDGAKLNDFVAWLQPKAGTYLPTELAYEGGLYVLTHNGILTRFDAKTGVQTYKTRIGEGGEFTSSPWAYNGSVFCMNEEGRTFVIRAGDKFELLGSNDLGRNGARHTGAYWRSIDPAHGESSLQHPKHNREQAPSNSQVLRTGEHQRRWRSDMVRQRTDRRLRQHPAFPRTQERWNTGRLHA